MRELFSGILSQRISKRVNKKPRIKDKNNVAGLRCGITGFIDYQRNATSVMKEFRILMLIIIAVYVKRILGNRYGIQ